MRRDELGIESDRLFETLPASSQRLGGQFVQIVATLQIRFVRRQIRRMPDCVRQAPPRADLQRRGDGAGDVVRIAIISVSSRSYRLGPQMIPVSGADQIRSHANAIAGPFDASLQDLYAPGAPPQIRVMSCSSPRNANAEVRAVTFRPVTCVSALMTSSARLVAEPLVISSSAHVHEGQHGDRRLVHRRPGNSAGWVGVAVNR